MKNEFRQVNIRTFVEAARIAQQYKSVRDRMNPWQLLMGTHMNGAKYYLSNDNSAGFCVDAIGGFRDGFNAIGSKEINLLNAYAKIRQTRL